MSSENLEHSQKQEEKPEQEKPAKGKVVCAWCQKEMGEKEGLKEGEKSHGICENCREKHFPGLGKK